MPIEDLQIPPTAYLSDRRKSPTIHAPHKSGRRAFGVKQSLPISANGSVRLPRVLREATSFIVMDENVKTEGIFRVSARVQIVEILREAYDRGQKFIVWSNGDAVSASSFRKEGTGDVWVDEIDQTEGYDLHTAAALVKLWYKELREAIFPPSSYQALEKFYGKPGISLDPPQLLAILSMDDEWSPISSKISRQILTMHLLPLFSRIAEFSDRNQMTPDNIAVCFAPNLLSGPDPIEDLRMSGIIRRILVAMIVHWEKDLAPFLDTSFSKYEESLRMPDAVEDREDPLEEEETKDMTDLEAQTFGITLLDNEDSDEEMIGPPPPLPPRPIATGNGLKSLAIASISRENLTSGTNSPSHTPGRSDSFSPTENSAGPVRRKPAPALMPLPRYSTIINDRPAVFQGMQYYNTIAPEEGENGLANQDDAHTLPVYEDHVNTMPVLQESDAPSPAISTRPSSSESSPVAEAPIQRKPLPKGAVGV